MAKISERHLEQTREGTHMKITKELKNMCMVEKNGEKSLKNDLSYKTNKLHMIFHSFHLTN